MSVSRNVSTMTRCCPTPTAFSLLSVRNWFFTDRSSSKPVTSSGMDGSGNRGFFGVSIEPLRWPSRSVPPRGPRSAPRSSRRSVVRPAPRIELRSSPRPAPSDLRSLPRSPPREPAAEPRSSRCGRPPPEVLPEPPPELALEPAPEPPPAAPPEPSRRSPPPPGLRRSARSGRPDDEPRRGSSSRGRRAGWSSDTMPGSIRCGLLGCTCPAVSAQPRRLSLLVAQPMTAAPRRLSLWLLSGWLHVLQVGSDPDPDILRQTQKSPDRLFPVRAL